MLGSTLFGAFILTLAALVWVGRPREANLSDLIAALPNPRPFVARLSGGFPYAPCERAEVSKDEIPKLVCAAPLASQVEPVRLGQLEKEFVRYARRQPEARQRHLSALWTLAVEGTRGNLDRAVEDLEAASKLEPKNGAILSDLAAAFTARAAKTDDARDLVRALDAAERAAQASPKMPEALWNRAVAREVFVRRPALEGWTKVLPVEVEREWSAQARQHLESLGGLTVRERWQVAKEKVREFLAKGHRDQAAEIVRRFPAESLELLLRELLPEWSEAATHGEGGASRLRSAADLAQLLAAFAQDSMFAEIAAQLERVGSRDTPRWLGASLADAHIALRNGYLAFDAGDYDAAAQSFGASQASFARNGSPLRHWAEYLVLRCAFRRGDYRAVLSVVPDHLHALARRHWPSLQGRLSWLLAAAQSPTGQSAASVAALGDALRAFQQVGDQALEATIRIRLANSWMELGELDKSWHERLLAFRALGSREGDLDYGVLLADAAARSLDLEGTEAALLFQREEVASAGLAGDPLRTLLALRHLGGLEVRLGRMQGARESLAEARSQARLLSTQEQRQFALDQIDVLEATTWRASDPWKAERLLGPVLDRFEAAGLGAFLPGVLSERGLARRVAGDVEGARTDLYRAAEAVESLTGDRALPDHKATLFEGSGAIYDELVEIELLRGDPRAALAAAERGKARALLDALDGTSGRETVPPVAWSPDAPWNWLSERLSPSAALVAFHLGRERSTAWVLRNGRTDHFRLSLGRAELRALLARLGRSTTGIAAEREPPLAQLFDLLLRPLTAMLSGTKTLHIVPDKEMAQIPFAALLDLDSGRRLIELYELDFMPSLLIASRFAAERPRSLPAEPSVLIVADPTPDTNLFPWAGPLPGARREAKAIARLFPRSSLLLGSEATPAALLHDFPGHQIVHIAAHVRAAGPSPVRSLLLLSPSPGLADQGVLRALELLGGSPGEVQLVVLAACSSAGQASTEQAAGFAWPFLSRGIPQVIATLTPVEDSVASQLIHDFYVGLEDGLPPAQSLRAAQLARIHPDDPRAIDELSWAAFQVFSLLPSQM